MLRTGVPTLSVVIQRDTKGKGEMMAWIYRLADEDFTEQEMCKGFLTKFIQWDTSMSLQRLLYPKATKNLQNIKKPKPRKIVVIKGF